MAPAKPTLKDIARLSEASPSTVSAVLSGAWQARRISAETAERIRLVAGAEGYSANMQARGLRRGRSGLIGLILPMHDNRFFAAMTQSFEARARERDLCPVVVSTLRDPEEERRTVERLIAYAVDALVIAGATDPTGLGALCRAAGLPHVYVDLPGRDAPSVVSDNEAGARALADAILGAMAPGDGPRSRPFFVGGPPDDDATRHRVEGFRRAVEAGGGAVLPEQVLACGYAPSRARAEVARLHERLGGLPAGLFINSLTVFEGVLAHLATLPPGEVEGTALGVYDYDPMAALLRFPVHMVRQNSAELVARAFALIDEGVTEPLLLRVPPDLVPPGTVVSSPFFDLG